MKSGLRLKLGPCASCLFGACTNPITVNESHVVSRAHSWLSKIGAPKRGEIILTVGGGPKKVRTLITRGFCSTAHGSWLVGRDGRPILVRMMRAGSEDAPLEAFDVFRWAVIE